MIHIESCINTMKTIRKIDTINTIAPIRKRVAAYARISIDPEHDSNSLSTQISYYSHLIQSNPAWVYVGVYADDGISGTSMKNRQEFLRMLEDADKGMIDIILTKSISRFARNTVDLLNTVRHLKDKGVSVRFEKENIDSMESSGEVLLTLLASFAQEEALSISANYQWAIDKKYEQGIILHNNVFGYVWDGKNLNLEPEEALIVRRIYDEYLSGKPTSNIIRDLNRDGYVTRRGYAFNKSTLHWILHNERYTGNTILRKKYRDDPLTKHSTMNYGAREKYYITDTNPAIVTIEEFERVQQMMAESTELGCYGRNANPRRLFSRRIKCMYCGSWYCRGSKAHREYNYWKCGLALKKGQVNCPEARLINEKALISLTSKILGSDDLSDEKLAQRLDFIEGDGNGRFIFHLKNGEIREECLEL